MYLTCTKSYSAKKQNAISCYVNEMAFYFTHKIKIKDIISLVNFSRKKSAAASINHNKSGN